MNCHHTPTQTRTSTPRTPACTPNSNMDLWYVCARTAYTCFKQTQRHWTVRHQNELLPVTTLRLRPASRHTLFSWRCAWLGVYLPHAASLMFPLGCMFDGRFHAREHGYNIPSRITRTVLLFATRATRGNAHARAPHRAAEHALLGAFCKPSPLQIQHNTHTSP